MNEELTQRIVNDLAKHRSRNDIVQSICEQTGLNWPEAEQLVQQVEADQAHTIARKQSPLLIFLSIGTLLIGVLLLIYSAEFFIAFFQGDTLEKILSVQSVYYRIGGGVVGIGMVVGGLVGLYNTTLQYFET